MNIYDADPLTPSESSAFEAAVAAQNASFARIFANRANAQLSTGPKTPQGKLVSSQNAVRTALTGATVLLPTDDADRYAAHLERFRRDHAPATERETELVQSLADTQWRLNRIPVLELSIYALGRAQASDLFSDIEDPATRALAIDGHTFETHFRRLNNLSIQETRLRRAYAKDLAELLALQSQRRDAAQPPLAARPTAAGETGFVFAESVQVLSGPSAPSAKSQKRSPHAGAGKP